MQVAKEMWVADENMTPTNSGLSLDSYELKLCMHQLHHT